MTAQCVCFSRYVSAFESGFVTLKRQVLLGAPPPGAWSSWNFFFPANMISSTVDQLGQQVKQTDRQTAALITAESHIAEQ